MGPPPPERLTISLGRFKSEKPEFTINALNDIISSAWMTRQTKCHRNAGSRPRQVPWRWLFKMAQQNTWYISWCIKEWTANQLLQATENVLAMNEKLLWITHFGTPFPLLCDIYVPSKSSHSGTLQLEKHKNAALMEIQKLIDVKVSEILTSHISTKTLQNRKCTWVLWKDATRIYCNLLY